ncbi:MAG: hypothetical protein ABI438_03365 [Dermatophilaceae bacterium]
MILLTVGTLYVLTSVLVVSVDSMAMRWVEKGQSDPFRNLDDVSMARLRV